ncbi:hypothetical protein CRUP_018651 [Coryphaenoides rupestris]|nr:hypothetical protein CRUP_018651 [Coryphaenoides rupestris]
MRDWSQRFKAARDGESMASGPSSSPGHSAARGAPAGVWVSHAPTPDDLSEDAVSERTASTGAPPSAEKQKSTANTDINLKDRLKSLLPKTLGSSLRRWTKGPEGSSSTEDNIPPDGTRVSPPVSPLTERRLWGGQEDRDEGEVLQALYSGARSPSSRASTPAEYYAEKVEVYKLNGPDSYGMTNGYFNNGQGLSGYSYTGPMTPFVLAVVGLSWVVTLFLLVLGMTMYYRAILLDSAWWPLTEALVNLVLFLLYMAAGIVYVNDLNRGGLCHMTVGLNPIVANLCRVDGGQMAGTAFLFMVMLMYLLGFMVALKMWRHEATRQEKERFRLEEEEHPQTVPLSRKKPKRISFKDDDGYAKPHIQKDYKHPVAQDYKSQNHSSHVMADYIK